MLDKLQPELVRKIAEQAIAREMVRGTPEDESAMVDQAILSRLMRVSRTLHDQVSPLLYRDCLITRPDCFVNALDSNPNIFQTSDRLRFAEAHVLSIPLYGVLIPDNLHIQIPGQDRWRRTYIKRRPQNETQEDWSTVAGYTLGWLHAALAMRRLLLQSPASFKAIEKVVMGCMAPFWYDNTYPRASHAQLAQMQEAESAETVSLSRSCLLARPRHYCQSDLFGVFALPPRNIVTEKPPKIATYHMPNTFSGHIDEPLRTDPPVVLGTVNRYIFTTGALSLVLPNRDPEHLTQEDTKLLAPLLRLARRREIFVVDGPAPPLDIEQSDLNSTTIEVYSYVERAGVAPSAMAAMLAGIDEFVDLAEHRQPLPLQPLQQYLDTSLGPKDIKISLKRLEDAPPCSACGLVMRPEGT